MSQSFICWPGQGAGGSFYFAENGEASFGEIGAAIAEAAWSSRASNRLAAGEAPRALGRVQSLLHARQQQPRPRSARAARAGLDADALVRDRLDPAGHARRSNVRKSSIPIVKASMLLKDKVCVVAGAASTRSIGYATAELFAEHGAKVVVVDLADDTGNA